MMSSLYTLLVCPLVRIFEEARTALAIDDRGIKREIASVAKIEKNKIIIRKRKEGTKGNIFTSKRKIPGDLTLPADSLWELHYVISGMNCRVNELCGQVAIEAVVRFA